MGMTGSRCSFRAGILLALLALVGTQALACATAAPRVLVLHVTNELGRTIEEIRMKGCDEPESSLETIDDSKLAPGLSRRFEMPPTCVDLVAYDARGRVVGEQRELTMISSATWVLKR
jgi:hypothetical protein